MLGKIGCDLNHFAGFGGLGCIIVQSRDVLVLHDFSVRLLALGFWMTLVLTFTGILSPRTVLITFFNYILESLRTTVSLWDVNTTSIGQCDWQ